MSPDDVVTELRNIEDRLVQFDRELAALHVEPCEKCSKNSGPSIQEVRLVGGYEAVLCRACRNAWMSAVDQSGYWIEYRKVVETAKAVRSVIEAGVRDGQGALIEGAVRASVEEVIAAERKLFQFAAEWLGETP